MSADAALLLLVRGLVLLTASGLANVLGGLAAGPAGARDPRRLNPLLAAVAGFLLAVAFLDLLPEVAERRPQAVALAFVGYLVVHFSENLYPAHGQGGHGPRLVGVGAALAGLAIHSFFDGVALAGALAAGLRTAVLVGAGIFLHSLPVGFGLASLVAAAGGGRRLALLATGGLLAATVAGGLAALGLSEALPGAAPAVVAVGTGALIYIGATDMVPMTHAGGSRRSLAFSLGGATSFLALSWGLRALGLD